MSVAIKKQHRKSSIISVGTIPNLMALRQAILQDAGYTVFSTVDFSQALSIMPSAEWGVLLLCYSVPGESRQKLIKQFRQCCPNGRIVAITNRPVTETAKDVDELVYGVEGPEALMQAVHGKAA